MVGDTVYIDPEDVRQVLEAMQKATHSKAFDSLRGLFLVNEFLNDPDLPMLHQDRDYAVQQVLIEIIEQELIRQREFFGLSTNLNYASMGDYQEAIRQDEDNSKELLYWSILYHDYVRVDLHQYGAAFEDIVYTSDRSIRRHKRPAVGRLTDHLIKAEWAARRRHRHIRLYTQMPFIDKPIHLYNREDLYKALFAFILEQGTPTIMLTGQRGIGKSTLIQKVIRALIDYDLPPDEPPLIDDLIWLKDPPDVETVEKIIQERLHVTNSRTTPRKWMTIYRLVVVLDDVLKLAKKPKQLDALLADLHPALVFVTGCDQVPLTNVDRHIILEPFDRESMRVFIRESAQQMHNASLSDAEIDALAERSGHNPKIARMLVHDVLYGDGAVDVIVWLMQDDHARLTYDEEKAWLCLALLPDSSIELPLPLCPAIRPDVMTSLARKHIVEKTDTQTYRLTANARDYLYILYEKDETCRNLIAQQLDLMADRLHHDPDLAMWMTHNLDQNEWFHLDLAIRRKWMSKIAQLDTAVLEDEANGLTKQIESGIRLRRNGQWQKSDETLLYVQQQAGKIGEFALQARARLERSIIKAYQGDYAEARRMLLKVRRIAENYKSVDLLDRATLQEAQLAIDSLDGGRALVLLDKIAQKAGLLYLALLAEAQMLVGDAERGRKSARKALEIAEKPQHIGQLYDLIGRSYYHESHLDEAEHHLRMAIDYFNRSGDAFSLARCQTNLGAALMEQNQYALAQEALQTAYAVQVNIGDQLGVELTHYNLNLLDYPRK